MANNDARVEWDGVDQMKRRMTEYAQKVHWAVTQVANYWAPVIETYAKEWAPWEDRTGIARASLHTFVESLSKDTVALYLAHGVEYGIWLEVANDGVYGIIWNALQDHFEAINKMLKGIFGNGASTTIGA